MVPSACRPAMSCQQPGGEETLNDAIGLPRCYVMPTAIKQGDTIWCHQPAALHGHANGQLATKRPLNS